MQIKIEDRFSLMELFAMFNIECNPTTTWLHSSRLEYDDSGKYVFNDIKVPLWGTKKRSLTRGEKNALQPDDNIRVGISNHPPGSRERIEDLARYYEGVDHTSDGESAFE